MDGQSLDITQDLIQKLKEVIPQAFSEDKIDFQRLHTLLGDSVNTDSERYGLSWAGKSDAYKVLQAPSTATLIPNPDESIDWDNAENIFIEGENLEVLKVLQKSYYGKVKMIYIDPPYNTGSDSFIYPDKFSETKEEYLKRINDKDESGFMMKEGLFRKNSKENGQYHSNWLNMMLPRLFLARNLLKEDGVIFVSIDDNEQANLKLLMDEIFGAENLIGVISWRRSDNQPNIGNFAKVKEYILCYSKNTDHIQINKLKLSDKAIKEYRYQDEKGLFRRGILFHKTRGRHYFDVKTKSGGVLNGPWMIKEKDFWELDKIGGIYWTSGGDEQPYSKIYLNDSGGQVPNDFWGIEFGTNQRGSLELEALLSARYFDFPKPVLLLKNLITIGSSENDIILDFFAGSGSTAQAVMELNAEDITARRYICVQMPEKTEEESEAYKAGYKTIADISKTRIEKVIEKITQERDGKLELENRQNLGFRKYTLASSNFKIWRSDIIETEDDLKNQMSLFLEPAKQGSTTENILWELLIKNGVPLHEKIVKLSLSEKETIYQTYDKKLAFVLDSYTDAIQEKVLEIKPRAVLCMDSLFTGNDNLKTNAQLKFEDNSISFKTV